MSKPKFLYTHTLPFNQKELNKLFDFLQVALSYDKVRDAIYEKSAISWEHFHELEAKLEVYQEKRYG